MIIQKTFKIKLNYNEATGIFTWVNTNKIAGSLDKDGYIIIGLFNKRYKAHRLAWFYVYEEWPNGEIDHINGIRNDNKINNLRVVSNRENNQNRKSHRSGRLLGCTYNKRLKKWVAQIQISGKKKHLGVYNTEEEANKVYLAALKERS